MAQRQMQHRAAADRAAHHHRPLELQRATDRHDGIDIEIGGELVSLALEAGRRRGFAVPRQIEDDDAEALGDLRIVQQRAILPPVGAGGVQADQRDPLARFLEIDAMRPAVEIEPR